MHTYKVPLRDVHFSLFELHDFPAHYQALDHGNAITKVDIENIVSEAAKFAERALVPLNMTGDTEGAHWDNGAVTAPAGFKEAYKLFVSAGWPRLGHPEIYGGTDLPFSLKQVVFEFLQSANQSWTIYAALNDGAIKTLVTFAAQAQIDAFVPKLVSGEWIGTMCVTEPHCGSDLGLVRTRAEPTGNGTYRISGFKIFISSGEQNFVENTVNLVLARVSEAPPGTRGLSLFVVPKRRLKPDGSPGEANGVHCVSVENKMGCKGSATCSMAFEEAEGWLIGELNHGLSCMFVYINKSRLGVGQQAYGQVEGAFQAGLAYARERLQGRSPGKATAPDQLADPLITHPDIRRMLLMQKAVAEGGRSLVHMCAQLVDLSDSGDSVARAKAIGLLALLIPVTKGFLSELGSEAADLGIQILGGHGYMKDGGVEQRVRDVRITRIYEGTTGIQAMDLLGRKVLGAHRNVFQSFTQEILDFCTRFEAEKSLERLVPQLRAAVLNWIAITDRIAQHVAEDVNLVGAVAVDYLMVAGYVTLAYVWARAAAVAGRKLADVSEESSFYLAKLQTADFYFDKLLPRATMHSECIRTGSHSIIRPSEVDSLLGSR